MRWHWPSSPKLSPLADVTVCACDFNHFGFGGKDSKNICEITYIFAPVCNSAIVGFSWTVMW